MVIDWNTDFEPPAQPHIAGMPVAELLGIEDEASPPAKVDPYDLAPLRGKLAPYEAELSKMLSRAEELEVTDDASAQEAVSLGARCQQIEKAVEDARAYFKAPSLAFGKSIDAFATAYKDKAQAAKRSLAGKVGQYQRKLEEEARELLRKQQEEARKLQEKANAEAAKLGTDAPAVIVPRDAPAPTKIRTTAGSATMAKRWVCNIVDPALVPREYCLPHQPLLNEAVKQGVRNIPGCEIVQEASARFGA